LITVTPNMGQLTTWTLVMLGFGFALSFDLSTVKRFPAGLDLRKIQNLMRIVDPKTCGCARPEQHCEVPVPEARFVGFSCKVGTFCCRMKKQPGRPNLKDFQRLIPTQQDSRSSQQLTRTRTSPTKQVLNINKEPVQKKEKVLKKQFTTQNHPIYNHNEIKTEAKKDDIEGIEPHQLGLPKDIKAFIKPVSQLQHRVLIAPVEETTEKKKDDKICKCEDTDDCPQEQRDYITFRKSCPFGQVQCCKNSELVVTLTEEKKFQAIAPETGREILSTTSKTFPVQIKQQTSAPISSHSQIRPVLIPVDLVPTTTKEAGLAEPIIQTSKDHLIDQTFRKKDITEIETTTTTNLPSPTTRTTTKLPTVTSTPPSVTLLYSATPFTIVSSSMSISKIEWDYALNKIEEKEDEKVFQVHNLPITNKQSTKVSKTKSSVTQTTPLVFSTRKPIFLPSVTSQPDLKGKDESPNIQFHERRPTQQTSIPQKVQQTNHQLRPYQQNNQQTGKIQIIDPRQKENTDRQPQNNPSYPHNSQHRKHNIENGFQNMQLQPTNFHSQYNNNHPTQQNIQNPSPNTDLRKFPNSNQPTARLPINPNKKYPVQPKPQQPRLHQPRLQQPRPQQPRPQQPRPQQPRPQQPRPHQPRPHQPRPQQPRPQQPRPQQPRPQQPRPQQPRPQQPRPPQTKQSFQQPIPGQIINRADTINQQFQPRQMGFVESVGDAAIKLVTKLFSWPF